MKSPHYKSITSDETKNVQYLASIQHQPIFSVTKQSNIQIEQSLDLAGCLGTAGSYGTFGCATGCAGTLGTIGTYGCLT